MCQAEEELKNASSNVQDSQKESEVKTEKVVSKVEETKPEPSVNDTGNSNPDLDWDDSIPF